MSIGRRGVIAVRVEVLAAVALACAVGSAKAGDPAAGVGQDMVSGPGATAKARRFPGLAPGVMPSAETVVFADPRHAPVQVMRGPRRAAVSPAPRRAAAPTSGRAAAPAPRPAAMPTRGHTETVSFGTGFAQVVTVVRGMTPAPAAAAHLAPLTRVERISFADPHLPAVTVLRGIVARDAFAADLFDPANGGELDRIAFAVDGAESRHGADLRMWRPEFTGPQGPMQVSAAAAFDVGGGDRFDLRENRLLGRAYLAQMFRRYGNWSDALAAYNWGPGNLDQWIAGGRNPETLPPETARYITRVLRDALINGAAAGL
jgi:transglycosylase-like protein with SLT domain